VTSAAECLTASGSAPEPRPFVWLMPEDHEEMRANYARIRFRRSTFLQPDPPKTTFQVVYERGPNPFAPKHPSWNKVSTSSSLVSFVERAFDPDRRLPFSPDVYWDDAYSPDPNRVSKGVQSEWESNEKHAGSQCEEATDAGLERTEEWWKKFRRTAPWETEVAEKATAPRQFVATFCGHLVIQYPNSPGGGILNCTVPDCASTTPTMVASAFELYGVPYALPAYKCSHHERALRKFKIPKWGQFARDARKASAWSDTDTKDCGSVAAADPDTIVHDCHHHVDEPPAKIAALMGKNYCASGPNRIFADRWIYSQQKNSPLWKEPSSSPDYRFLLNEDDDPELRPPSLVYGDDPGRVREINVDTSEKDAARCARILAAGIQNQSMIPAQEPFDERIEILETLTDNPVQLTREQRIRFIEEAKHQYYLGEIDMPRFGAFYCMTFEDAETAQLSKKMGMTPESLRKDWRRFMETILNPVELEPKQESINILAKLTPAQLKQIDVQGGVQAIRWTGGRNVQIMDITTTDGHPCNIGDFDGWLPEMFDPSSGAFFSVVDDICTRARERSQYDVHVDNLSEGAVLVPGAWKDDRFARALAKELWSRVLVFNFGAPEFSTRYLALSDEDRQNFVQHGYIPRFTEHEES
jgi:hypothetical protein